jgi:hypothetical protein
LVKQLKSEIDLEVENRNKKKEQTYALYQKIKEENENQKLLMVERK